MKALNINTRNKLNTLKQQAGMTLTESLLVLAVGALVAVLAYGGYKMAVGGVNEQAAVDSSARMLSAIKKAFGSSGNYTTDVTTLNLAKSGIVPAEFKTDITGTGTITPPWGAGSTVTIAGTGTSAAPVATVPVTFAAVPQNVCLALMAGIEGFTDSMTATPAGGSAATVKATGQTFNSGLAAAQCGAASTTIVATIK